MTLFIDLRVGAVGGVVAAEASVWRDGNLPVSAQDFASRVQGRDLLLATHGFNVDRAAGVQSLGDWLALLPDDPQVEKVGVLWPGDSRWVPVLDYPAEGSEAMRAAQLLAGFLGRFARDAASLRLVSHSLGARVVLETVRRLPADAPPVAHLMLMAGAIENDTLSREYADVAARVGHITTVASTKDWVLQYAFPAGNLLAQLLISGHPCDRTALGRRGPKMPVPDAARGGQVQVPASWDYVHGDYLPDHPPTLHFDAPVGTPGDATPAPGDPHDQTTDWKGAWSAGLARTRLF